MTSRVNDVGKRTLDRLAGDSPQRRTYVAAGTASAMFLIFLVVGVGHGHGHPSRGRLPTTTTPAPLSTSTTPPNAAGTGGGPTSQDQAVHSAVLQERPALEHLPWTGAGAAITLVGYDPDGAAVVAVSTSGDVGQAKEALSTFLAAFHDPGVGYDPKFYTGLTQVGP